jgi:hypothetical protein
MTAYSGSSWSEADAFLNGGRTSFSHRNFGKTRTVERLPNGDIAVRLHYTRIVTYHKEHDGWATIDMGGWDTVTTKKDISRFTSVRVGRTPNLPKDVRALADKRALGVFDFPEALDLCVYEPGAPVSPERVWKCRQCSGVGQISSHCPGRTGLGYCSDGKVETLCRHRETDEMRPMSEIPYGEQYYCAGSPWVRTDETAERPCRHGRTQMHYMQALGCAHALMEPHLTWSQCWRCKGEGVTDYGSRRIPTLVSANRPFLVDAAGHIIAQGRRDIGNALSLRLVMEAKRRIHASLRDFELERSA